MSFELHQILYKEEQRQHLYTFAHPYFNDRLSIFFENGPIAEIVPKSEGEKIAVCSWKLAQKMRRIHPVTEEALNRDYEVLSFTRNSSRHQMLALAHHWHPMFTTAIKLLWSKLGFTLPGEPRSPIYQNHYAAKAEIYKRYVREFLQPAIDLINTDEELNTIMKTPSNYGRLSQGADLKAVKAGLGMEDFPLCPFVLERCPSCWFHIHRINVSYL